MTSMRTKEECEKIIELYSLGYKIVKISKQLSIPRSTVTRILNNYKKNSNYLEDRTGKSYTKEELEIAIAKSTSRNQVLRALNLLTGSFVALDKAIKEFNIDISHFKKEDGTSRYKLGFRTDISIYLTNKVKITSYELKNRLIKENIFPHKCSSCGLSEWLGGKIPIELDHINGDRYDNSIENLRILCPNCHALTDTYCGKNRKNKILKIPVNQLRYCECGNSIRGTSNKCKACAFVSNRPPNPKKPTKEIFEKLVQEKSTPEIAKELDVSTTTVVKWRRKYAIPDPPQRNKKILI